MNLKDLLKSLDAAHGSKLEVMSGRRPRVLKNGEMKNLADEILTDDEVIELCRQAGGGRRLEELTERPTGWTFASPAGALLVSASLRGREVFASFTFAPRDDRESAPSRAADGGPMSGGAASRRRDATTKGGIKMIRRPSREAEVVRPRAYEPPAPRSRRTSSTEIPEQRSGRTDNLGTDGRKQPTKRPPASVTRRDLPPSRRHSDPSLRSRAPEIDRRAEPRLEPRAERADDGAPRRPREEPRPPLALDPRTPLDGAGRRVDLVLELVRAARRAGATDVHLTAGSPPYMRTPAGLVPIPQRSALTRSEIDRAFSALVPDELLGRLKTAGGVSFAATLDASTRVRVNATTTLEGPKLAMRILHASPPTFEELRIPQELVRAIEHPQGLVVVTGPSGQGKTTTVAALVQQINATRAVHVIMVEDPIEIPVTSSRAIVSQREIGAHAASFERALKGALRQDPDVIVIGELRDVETVRIALTASETGHLVIGTMNTPSTKAVVDRLIDLFPVPDQPQVRHTLAGGLRMICSQRMVARADGKGRVPAFELLPGSTALWNLIREDKTFQIPSLIQRGRGANILRMTDSLAELVRSGQVDRDAALEAALDPDDLDQVLSGGGAPSTARGAEGAPADGPETPKVASTNEEVGLGALLSKAGAIFSRRGGG